MTGIYGIVSILLAGLVLWGIRLMSSPKTAVLGNRLSALSMLAAILLVLGTNGVISMPLLWTGMIAGGIVGWVLAIKVTMIRMPEMVALLNGLGGGASALVALVEIIERFDYMGGFARVSGELALVVGAVTLSGSLIAAGKLSKKISGRPVVLPRHGAMSTSALLSLVLLVIIAGAFKGTAAIVISLVALVISLSFGVLFALRVGGADMPITISLLNSLSGLAGAICGFTVSEPLLVAVGAIVGASGLILTKIMCSAMNRSIADVLRGPAPRTAALADEVKEHEAEAKEEKAIGDILKEAKNAIVIPGYGMAIAQAQAQVKRLMDTLESKGKEVRFAIHPVAGRMPGHMNVLLAEVDVPYDKLCEMEEINPKFENTDVVIIVGACDVVNPAASTAEGTPIYGMPVLKAEEAKHVIVCNLDTKPGYSGVDNSLYELPHVHMLLGNAAETVNDLIAELD